jgi:hypothetical protein
MIDAAMGMASRLRKLPAVSDAGALASGFQLAVSRSPDDRELGALMSLLDEERKYYAEHPSQAEALIESADDFLDVSVAEPAELAAWTSVARALLNLHETVTRN